VLIVLSINYK